MKIARFNGDRIGVVQGQTIVDITEVIQPAPAAWPPVEMLRLIAEFPQLRAAIEDRVVDAKGVSLAEVRLECPVPWPNKVIAYPANYHAHIEEMKAGTGLISRSDASKQGFFLKANSSLSGPSDPILLPDLAGREVHHECELAIIIGKGGRSISREDALDHIFGYACLVDVVIRGVEERVMRKSFDTFCPLGPYLTTRDEITHVDDIDLELTVNGELRQKANTRNLIVDVPEMVALASSVMTLYPGDIIASGTPAGVGPIKDGDILEISVAGVGSMKLPIKQDKHGKHSVWKR